MFRISVVSWRHLDDVSRDKIDAFQSANDSPKLARCPAASFRSAGRRSNYYGGQISFDEWEMFGSRRRREVTYKRDQGYRYQ